MFHFLSAPPKDDWNPNPQFFLAPLKNLSQSPNLLTSLKRKSELSCSKTHRPLGGIKNGMFLVLVHLLWNTSPWQQRLSFACTIFPTWERVCVDRVRSLMSMCSMLLGYSLEPGLVAVRLLQHAPLWPLVYQEMDSHSSINQFDDRKQDTTSKPWHHLDRAFFPLTQEDKRKICLQGREHFIC